MMPRLPVIAIGSGGIAHCHDSRFYDHLATLDNYPTLRCRRLVAGEMGRMIVQPTLEVWGKQMKALVLAGLRKHFNGSMISRKETSSMVLIPECRIGVGWGPDNEQRIDLLVLSLWKTNTYGKSVIAVEIKTSRSDLLREIKDSYSRKQKRILNLCHYFFYATPPGLFEKGELPPWAGLIEVGENIRIVVRAPYREAMPTWSFLFSILRKM